MNGTDPQQIRRWQEEVARDPGSAAFLPLAEAYRREGRLEVARRLCVRGLERNPENVEGHVLLGRLHRQSGELDRAYDEMDIALGLDPAHREARRAIGYLSLERRDWPAAIRHLEAAAAEDPRDARIASALALARRNAAAEVPAVERESERLAPMLERFVRDSSVRLALLLEGSGRIVAQHGFSRDLDLAAFATLAAGIQSAGRALAGITGQRGFDQLYQGEGEQQIFLAPLPTPSGELVVLAVFGEASSIGLVRVRFEELVQAAAALDWAARPAPDVERFEAELAAGLDRARAGDDRPGR